MSWASDLLGKCGLSYVVYQALYRAVLFFEIDAQQGNEFDSFQLFCRARPTLSYLGARDVREEYKKVEAIRRAAKRRRRRAYAHSGGVWHLRVSM